MSMQTASFTLTPKPPFDFDLLLTSLRNSAGTVLEVIGDDDYRRALRLAGRPALLRVRSTGTLDAPGLQVEVTTETVDRALLAAAQERAAHVFGAAVDAAGVDAIDDPVFQAAWQACRGFRPIQVPDLFETIAWAIIGQQINVTFAARCKRALTTTHGSSLEVDGVPYLLFPTAEELAALDDADLLALQFSRQKARYVLGLARAVAEGRFDLTALPSLPPDEALARLMTLLGVGRWTAEYVLLRGLGYPDSLPAGDVALQKAVGHAYGLARLATEAEVRTLGERWQPWRSYATITFWHHNALARLQASGGKRPAMAPS